MHNENWDDLRFVIAVYKLGSVLQAAQTLGVNHATVLRRVSAFEERHGGPIFQRTPQGYRLLTDKQHVLRAAQAVETSMAEVARLAAGGQTVLEGAVRITTTDTFACHVLPDFVAQAMAQMSGVTVTIISNNSHVDLIRENAQLTLRPANSLPDDLIGTRVGILQLGTYAAPGAPPDRWLAMTGALSRTTPAQWLAKHVPAEQFGAGGDSFLTLLQLAAAGAGIAVLPAYIARLEPRLNQIQTDLPNAAVPIWIARHIDASTTPTVRAVEDRLTDFMQQQSSRLMGFGS